MSWTPPAGSFRGGRAGRGGGGPDHDHDDDGGGGDDGDDCDDNHGDGGPGGGRTCSWLLAKKGWGALGGRAGLYGWPCG